MKSKIIYIIFILSCFCSNNLLAERMLPPGDSTITYVGCEGDGFDVTVNGITYDENNPAGTETFPGGSSDGTDSIVTVNLNFNPNPSPFINSAPTICMGDCKVLYSGNFDSYLWSDGSTDITLTICSPGTYTVTVTNTNGCTASYSKNFTEVALPTPSITGIENSGINNNDGGICDGDNITLELNNSYFNYSWSTSESASSITVASQGGYTVTVTDNNLCEATAYYYVAVNPNPDSPTISMIENSGSASDDGFVCDGNGDFFILEAGIYADYDWSTGEPSPDITVSEPSTYSVTVYNTFGCTNSASYTINIENITGEETYNGCPGDGYEVVVNGTTYDEANPTGTEYIDIGTGCDSVVTINLNFDEAIGEENYFGCQGDGYIVNVNATIYDESNPTGTEIITNGSYLGCDSIIIVNLIFNAESYGTESYIGCEGDGYAVTVYGTVYDEGNPTGTEVISSGNYLGCDSIVTVNLVFNPASSGTESYVGQEGDGYAITVNGTTYDEINPTGTESINEGNQYSCDSTVTINLVFTPPSTSYENYMGCQGDGYAIVVNGTTYDELMPTGTEIIPGGSSIGTDSTIIIDLFFSPPITGFENYVGCQGDGYSVVVNGTTYDESNPLGTENIIGGSYLGCDSLVTVELIFNPETYGTQSYVGCEGDGYEIIINGTVYNELNTSGTETITNFSVQGCDSIVTVNLVFNPASSGTESYVGQEGDGYAVTVNGGVYNEANPVGTEVIQNVLGCDSTVTIDLVFNPVAQSNEDYIGCQGDGYEVTVNGTVYNESTPNGFEVIPGGSVLGTDSTIVINLIYNPPSSGTESYVGLEGDGYEIDVNGNTYNESNPTGTETFVGLSEFGCDSIVTIDLVFYPATTNFIDHQGCSGDGYSITVNGVIYDESNPSGTEVIVGGASTGLDSTIVINLEFTVLDISLSGNGEINCENQTATITSTLTGLPDSPIYTWSNGMSTPDITVSATGDYIVTVSEASGCTAVSTFTVTESQPTDCVFPGDANYDFVVNSYDHLTVCLAGGDTGPARQTQGNNFLPHYMLDWNDEVYAGLDKKHLDCDGNGVINSLDLNAVFDNYTLQHDGMNPLRIQDGHSVRLVFDDLYIIEGQNTTVTGNIILDNPDTQEDILDLYGILFTIEYDEMFIEEGTFNITYLDNGWLGTAAEIAPLYKDFYDQGLMDVAFTRGDQVAASGSGVIATVEFVIEDNLIGLTADYEIDMNITGVYAHSNNAEPIAFNPEAEDVNISIIATSTDDILSEDLIDVYPNPTSGKLMIDMNNLSGESYALYNTIGQLVDENIIVNEITELDLNNLSSGIYILNIKAKEGNINIKVIID